MTDRSCIYTVILAITLWFVVNAAPQATEWQQRGMFLMLALMWGAAAQQCRKEASTETQAQCAS